MPVKIEVWVKSASGLKHSDLLDTPDPYVLVYLDGVEIMKTKWLKDEANPVWNEKSGVVVNSEKNLVRFVIMDKDRFTKDDFIGEASVSLMELKKLGSVEQSMQVLRDGKPVGVLFVQLAWTEE